MSKSLGNVVAPQDVMQQSGADILRLWVVGSDYTEDLRIGPEILKHQSDVYRRLRNTLRYLLGALDGFAPAEAVGARGDARAGTLGAAPPGRARSAGARARSRTSISTRMFTALHNFCAVDLSAFYFDIRKDRLYCDAPDDIRRRAARTVLDRIFDCLVRWLAPILCFTAEEAWLARHGDDAGAQRPSRIVRRGAGGLARPGARRALGRAARSAPGRHRRARARARRQSASAPACRPRSRSSCPDGSSTLLRGIDLAELCITSAGDGPRRRRPGRRLHAARCRRISASWYRRRRASAASAAGGCCPRSGRCPAMPICAAAAPRSSDRGAATRDALPASRAGDAGARARRCRDRRDPRSAQQGR